VEFLQAIQPLSPDLSAALLSAFNFGSLAALSIAMASMIARVQEVQFLATVPEQSALHFRIR
jgi:hypothetical protein